MTGLGAQPVRARVLIVDDDEVSRVAVAAALRDSCNEIAFAASGPDALDLARQWEPDVIILDLMMPEIDGLETCRRLRVDPVVAPTRVFILTSVEDPSARLTAFEAGADEFLHKPIHRAEALARIRSIARLNRYRALLEENRRLHALVPHAPHQAGSPRPGTELRESLERALASVHLALQPIFSVREGQAPAPFAQEALLRSEEPLFSSPSALVDAASAVGCLPRLGAEIRHRASQAIAGLAPEVLLFVNLTAAELDDDSLTALDAPLLPHASRVVLELTEREPLEGVRDVRSRIATLRALGFRFAIDDLGAGYSSLNSFAVVEPEFVKLDRMLVTGLAGDPVRRTIIGSILALCRQLGIALIAEGVETEPEREALLGLGIELLQGYLFGRPRALGAQNK